MPKIEWLGTPIGCPCFFSQVPSLVPLVPEEPDTVGQVRLRSPGQGLVLRTPYPAPRVPQLRTPPVRTLPCPGTMSRNEDHVHFIPLEVNAFTLLPEVPASYGIEFSAWLQGSVQISWQDVRAGVAKSYVTTEQHGHTHVLLLTAGELATLRSGGRITKQTSRNARPGSRQHTHTVTISCRA